jgi:DNA polymerase-3 subunit delta
MRGWVVNEAKNQGGQIEPQAAVHLAEMLGQDTRQASMEITKLLTYVDFAHPIGVEDVQAVSVTNPQGNIFALVDALAASDVKRGQKMLRQLLEAEEPFAIFGMVVRQFRMLILAREELDAGGNLASITSALGVHPYVAEKVFSQARAFRMGKLETIYRALLQMDEDAKTSQVPLDLALDMFVAEMGRQAG